MLSLCFSLRLLLMEVRHNALDFHGTCSKKVITRIVSVLIRRQMSWCLSTVDFVAYHYTLLRERTISQR